MTLKAGFGMGFDESLEGAVMTLVETIIYNESMGRRIPRTMERRRLPIVVMVFFLKSMSFFQTSVIRPPTMMRRHLRPAQRAGEQRIDDVIATKSSQQFSGANGLSFSDGGQWNVGPSGERFLASWIFAVP